jgi:outer membrane lipoprotein carrier protein
MKLKESGDMRTPLAFLMGRLDLRRDFRRFEGRSVGENLEMVAFPTSNKAPFDQVTFVLTPEYRIEQLEISGQDGSVMRFQFSEERIDPPLTDNLFEFKIPKGAEFVEIDDEE